MLPPNAESWWKVEAKGFLARLGNPKFTMVFNGALESLMADVRAPFNVRWLAWAQRRSWGNFSERCIDGIGGRPLFQVDAAKELYGAEFGETKKAAVAVSKAVKFWGKRGYVVAEKDRTIKVVDRPNPWLTRTPMLKSGNWERFLEHLRQTAPERLHRYESAAHELKLAKGELLGDFAKFQKGEQTANEVTNVGNSPAGEKVTDVGNSSPTPVTATGYDPTPEPVTSVSAQVAHNTLLLPEAAPALTLNSEMMPAAAAVVRAGPPPPPPIGNGNGNSHDADVTAVLKAFREFGWGDRQIAAETLEECRRRPGGRECSGEDVAKQVRKRGREARQKEHPAAWLRGAVPWAFDDDTWKTKAAAAPGRNYKYV